MKTNAWAVWGPLRLGDPGPAGPLDKMALDIIGLQSYQTWWKTTQNKGCYAVQCHSRSSRSVPIESPYSTSY